VASDCEARLLVRYRVRLDLGRHPQSVSVAQWKKYGLALIPLYVAAGSNPLTNRFEVEAGLKKGGYTR